MAVSWLLTFRIGYRFVLGYPAVAEVIGIPILPVLVAYLNGEGMFVLREQGTLLVAGL
jgi:hypothetical protein